MEDSTGGDGGGSSSISNTVVSSPSSAPAVLQPETAVVLRNIMTRQTESKFCFSQRYRELLSTVHGPHVLAHVDWKCVPTLHLDNVYESLKRRRMLGTVSTKRPEYLTHFLTDEVMIGFNAELPHLRTLLYAMDAGEHMNDAWRAEQSLANVDPERRQQLRELAARFQECHLCACTRADEQISVTSLSLVVRNANDGHDHGGGSDSDSESGSGSSSGSSSDDDSDASDFEKTLSCTADGGTLSLDDGQLADLMREADELLSEGGATTASGFTTDLVTTTGVGDQSDLSTLARRTYRARPWKPDTRSHVYAGMFIEKMFHCSGHTNSGCVECATYVTPHMVGSLACLISAPQLLSVEQRRQYSDFFMCSVAEHPHTLYCSSPRAWQLLRQDPTLDNVLAVDHPSCARVTFHEHLRHHGEALYLAWLLAEHTPRTWVQSLLLMFACKYMAAHLGVDMRDARMRTLAGGYWDDLKAGYNQAKDYLASAMPDASTRDAITARLRQFAEQATEQASRAYEGLRTAAVRLGESVGPAYERTKQALAAGYSATKDAAARAYQQATEVGGRLYNQARDASGRLYVQARDASGRLYQQAKDAGGRLYDKTKEAAVRGYESAKQYGAEAWEKTRESARELMRSAVQAREWLKQHLQTTVDAIRNDPRWDTLSQKLSALQQEAADSGKRFWQYVQEKIKRDGGEQVQETLNEARRAAQEIQADTGAVPMTKEQSSRLLRDMQSMSAGSDEYMTPEAIEAMRLGELPSTEGDTYVPEFLRTANKRPPTVPDRADLLDEDMSAFRRIPSERPAMPSPAAQKDNTLPPSVQEQQRVDLETQQLKRDAAVEDQKALIAKDLLAPSSQLKPTPSSDLETPTAPIFLPVISSSTPMSRKMLGQPEPGDFDDVGAANKKKKNNNNKSRKQSSKKNKPVEQLPSPLPQQYVVTSSPAPLLPQKQQQQQQQQQFDQMPLTAPLRTMAEQLPPPPLTRDEVPTYWSADPRVAELDRTKISNDLTAALAGVTFWLSNVADQRFYNPQSVSSTIAQMELVRADAQHMALPPPRHQHDNRMYQLMMLQEPMSNEQRLVRNTAIKEMVDLVNRIITGAAFYVRDLNSSEPPRYAETMNKMLEAGQLSRNQLDDLMAFLEVLEEQRLEIAALSGPLGAAQRARGGAEMCDSAAPVYINARALGRCAYDGVVDRMRGANTNDDDDKNVGVGDTPGTHTSEEREWLLCDAILQYPRTLVRAVHFERHGMTPQELTTDLLDAAGEALSSTWVHHDSSAAFDFCHSIEYCKSSQSNRASLAHFFTWLHSLGAMHLRCASLDPRVLEQYDPMVLYTLWEHAVRPTIELALADHIRRELDPQEPLTIRSLDSAMDVVLESSLHGDALAQHFGRDDQRLRAALCAFFARVDPYADVWHERLLDELHMASVQCKAMHHMQTYSVLPEEHGGAVHVPMRRVNDSMLLAWETLHAARRHAHLLQATVIPYLEGQLQYALDIVRCNHTAWAHHAMLEVECNFGPLHHEHVRPVRASGVGDVPDSSKAAVEALAANENTDDGKQLQVVMDRNVLHRAVDVTVEETTVTTDVVLEDTTSYEDLVIDGKWIDVDKPSPLCLQLLTLEVAGCRDWHEVAFVLQSAGVTLAMI